MGMHIHTWLMFLMSPTSGSDDTVQVKILRDSGTALIFDESILPFYEKTDSGDRILMRGMGLNVLPVPVQRKCLHCELVQGKVPVAVRPALPVEGILGNDLAGRYVTTFSCDYSGNSGS